MDDINFFNNYTKKKSIKIDKQRILYFAIILCIGLVIIFSIFNQIKIIFLSKDLNNLIELVEDERIQSEVNRIEEKEIELNGLVDTVEILNILDNHLDENNNINGMLLETINSSIPDEIFFTSISMYEDYIEIIGKSNNRESIGILMENLEKIEDFKRVLISSMSNEDDYYNFIININLESLEMEEEL